MKDFTPGQWLAAAISTAGTSSVNREGAFKVLSSSPNGMRVLHKESGAVWSFAWTVEREAAA